MKKYCPPTFADYIRHAPQQSGVPVSARVSTPLLRGTALIAAALLVSGVALAGTIKPTMGINPHRTVTVIPSKFTKITVSSTNVLVGAPMEIKVYGVGEPDPNKQGCAIVMKPYDKTTGKELWGGYAVLSGQGQQWPKTRTLSFNTPGTYVMTAEVLANAAACGYQGPGSIPGDLQVITVGAIPK
jgi:hypothetical protein